MYQKTYFGVTEKHKTSFYVLTVVQALLGLIIIICAFAVKIDGDFTSSSSGEGMVINGVHYNNVQTISRVQESLPEGVQAIMVILGLGLIASGLSNVYAFLKTNKSFVTVGDTFVFGCQYSCVLFITSENKFNLTYDQIGDVQVSKVGLTPTLSIQTMTKEYKVTIAQADEAMYDIKRHNPRAFPARKY